MRIGLLVLSDFALIFPGLPNNCFVVFLVALHVPFKPNWMQCVWKQVSQQNPSVVIQDWTRHDLCCRHEVWKRLGFFFFFTKWPSAALQAEPWKPIGWLRRGCKRLKWLLFVFSAVLCKMTIPEELEDRWLKIAFFGTQCIKRTTYMTECTELFMFTQEFRFFLLILLCCTQKEDKCSLHHF